MLADASQDQLVGLNLSDKDMKPEKDKLEKIKKLQPPTTVKEIRMAIGLFQFFR